MVDKGIEPFFLKQFIRLSGKTREKCVNGACGKFYKLASKSWSPDWELNFFKDMLEEVEQDNIFYDIGAQYGVYSALVGSQLDYGQVRAFEPSPVHYAHTQLHLELNNVNGSVRRTALLDHEDGNSGWLQDERFPFPVTSGDEYIKTAPSPTLMKIDVEGGELQTLRGFSDCLAKNPPRTIYIELHKKANGFSNGLSGSELKSLYSLLEHYEYDITVIEGRRGGSDFIKAKL